MSRCHIQSPIRPVVGARPLRCRRRRPPRPPQISPQHCLAQCRTDQHQLQALTPTATRLPLHTHTRRRPFPGRQRLRLQEVVVRSRGRRLQRRSRRMFFLMMVLFWRGFSVYRRCVCLHGSRAFGDGHAGGNAIGESDAH